MRTPLAPLFVVAALGAAPALRAGPLVLTGGSVTAELNFTYLNNFAGEGFAATSVYPGEGGNFPILMGSYDIGATASVFGYFSDLIGYGPGSYNGVDYAKLYWAAAFNFSGTVTATPGTGTGPFTFTGVITGYTSSPFVPIEPPCVICRLPLTGTGVASVVFKPFQLYPGAPTRVDAGPVTYNFMTPEPSTWLLAAGGLLPVLIRRRRYNR